MNNAIKEIHPSHINDIKDRTHAQLEVIEIFFGLNQMSYFGY